MSIIVVKCNKTSGAVLSIVSTTFSGGNDRTTVFSLLPHVDAVYMVYVLCLGQAPTAAQQTKQQAFITRFYSSQPLLINTFPSNSKAPIVSSSSSSSSSHSSLSITSSTIVASQHCVDGIYSNPKQAFLHAWHLAILYPCDTSKCLSQKSISNSTYSHNESFLVNNNEVKYVIPEPPFLGRSFLKENGKLCEVLVLQSRNALIFMVVNKSKPASSSFNSLSTYSDDLLQKNDININKLSYKIKLKVMVKSHIGRDVNGMITNNQTLADEYYKSEELKNKAMNKGGSISSKYTQNSSKWPAKWKGFETESIINSGEQKVVMIIVKSGVQSEIGLIECDITDYYPSSSSSSLSSSSSSSSLSSSSTLHHFFNKESSNENKKNIKKKTVSDGGINKNVMTDNGIFTATCINEDIFKTRQQSYHTSNRDPYIIDHHGGGGGESDVDKAIEKSLIEASIAQSLKDREGHGNFHGNFHHPDVMEEEDDQLIQAMIESTKHHNDEGVYDVTHFSTKSNNILAPDKVKEEVVDVTKQQNIEIVDIDDDEMITIVNEGKSEESLICATCTFINLNTNALSCGMCGAILKKKKSISSSNLTKSSNISNIQKVETDHLNKSSSNNNDELVQHVDHNIVKDGNDKENNIGGTSLTESDVDTEARKRACIEARLKRFERLL